MVLNIVFYKLSISANHGAWSCLLQPRALIQNAQSHPTRSIGLMPNMENRLILLLRAVGLALASPSKQSDSGLNFLGEELADAALHGVASSSNAVTELSGSPPSMDGDGSTLITASTPPDAPPSVAKPRVPQGLKIREPTSVQKALFQASPLPAQSQELSLPVISDAADPLSPPPGRVAITDAANTTPADLASPASTDTSDPTPPVTEVATEKRCRGASAKVQADVSGKKKKAYMRIRGATLGEAVSK